MQLFDLDLCLIFLAVAFYQLNKDIFHFVNEFLIEMVGMFQQGNKIFDFNNFNPPSFNIGYYVCHNFCMHSCVFNFIIEIEN